MARYEFKLPDIGEGIAEAEIVAWHVKVGDTIGEDQQIADMMTDKATVEMESPVAGKVVELAGEVGDQVPIGSVLAVIETEGADRAAEPVEDSKDERPLADGAVEATPEQAEEIPVEVRRIPSLQGRGRGRVRSAAPRRACAAQANAPRQLTPKGAWERSPRPRLPRRPRPRPRSRHRPRAGEDRRRPHPPLRPRRLSALQRRHASRRAAPPLRRADETIKVVGLRRKIAENMAEAKRRIPHFTLVEEFDVTALEDTRRDDERATAARTPS